MALTILFLLAALGDQAAHLTGRVLDPQGLPVTAAPVELRCEGRLSRTRTGSRGEFEFDSPSPMTGCKLSLRRDGFAPYTATIEGGQDHLVVKLQIAQVTESTEVAASISEPPSTAPVGSIMMTSEELRRISNRTEDLIRQAVLAAAGNAGPSAIYVDGLPAHVLPPVEMIERLGVNLGPFSAEYGDGDANRVEITTRGASRRFRISPSVSLLGLGGGSSLRPGTRSESRSGGVSVSGPLRAFPLTLFGDVSVTNNRSELPIEAVMPTNAGWAPGLAAPRDATRTNRVWSGSAAAHYAPASGLKIHTVYYGRRSRGSNVGVGGVVLPEAGFSDEFASDNVQVSVRAERRGLLHEGGLVIRNFSSELDANSTRIGLSVAGSFVAGGAAVTRQETRRAAWIAKYVVRRSSKRPWTAGLVISATAQSIVSVPNASGSLEFEHMSGYTNALEGGATAIWRGASGWGRVEHQNATLAPFLQKTIMQTRQLQVDGGVRADFQSEVGAVLSPRLWATSLWKGFKVQGGTGLFVYSVPDAVFIAPLRTTSNLQQHVATGAGMADPSGGLSPLERVNTQIAHDLVSPRQWMQRGAIERRVGAFTPSLEYTWARDYHRLGSDRLPAGPGWLDTIESNRSAVRHRLHGRLRYAWRRHTVVGHYEWIRAADNSDGPFSYPERGGQYALEWARSAVFAPHNVTVAGTLSLPAGFSMMLTDTWQSGVPYNITSGADDDRNGLLTERGGRPRNSGTGAEQHAVSLHASRRFAIPPFMGRSNERVFVTTGVQIENLLDRTNVTGVGSVASAATFGMPLSAQTGRALRFWISVY